MADFPYRWMDIPDAPYQISEPLQNERGEWHVATKFGDLHWESFYGPTATSAAFRAVEGCEHELRFQQLASTEPTPEGLQYVIPGCEKDQSRGPVQMSLF